MKLVFITNNFPPIVDGVGDYAYHLAQEFVKNGHEVTIICTAKPEIIEFLSKNNLNVKVYPIVENWNIKGIYTAYQQIKQLQPDWILLQYVPYSYQSWGLPIMKIILLLFIKISKLPTITTFHEVAIRWNLRNPKYFFIGLTQRIIAGLLTFLSTKIATSISSYAIMLKRWSKECYRIPVGSNILPNTNFVKPTQNNGTISIATFGKRDLFVLLQAFEMLVEEDMYITLKIVGEASNNLLEQIGNLKQTTHQRIHCTGYLPDHQVFEALSEADLFILPEFVNNKKQGGVALKSGALAAAFAAGLPVISTLGDMTDKELANSGAIRFCEYSAEEFYRCIAALLERQENLNIMSKAAEKFYNDNLSWDIISQQYLMLLQHDQKNRQPLSMAV